MLIKKISIRNYKSIKNLDIDLGTMNAFIGPNNAGKSNILSAINLILGETYPSSKSFSEKDFYNRDVTYPIEIKVIFDSSLGSFYSKEVWGFHLKAYESTSGIETSYFAVDKDGIVLKYGTSGGEMKVSNIMRDKVVVLFLGSNRDIESQLRTTQWTVYGKIIKHLNYKLPQESKEQFDTKIKDSTQYLDTDDYTKFKQTMQKVVKENTGLDIKIEFQAFDPINLYRNIKVFLKEVTQEMHFEAEDMGRGVQGIIALGLLLSYKKLVRDAPILLVEEPETYLHPHGCRHFYSNLKKFAQEGIQIIYTTHSPFFIPVEDYKNIFLTRKIEGKTTVRNMTESIPLDVLKFTSMFNEKLNEIFFANVAILVEGPVDKIFLTRAFDLGDIKPDIKNISVAECGGICEIKFLAKILKELGVNVIIVCDKDEGNIITQREINEISRIIGNENILLYDSSLEEEYGIKKLSKAEAIKKSLEYISLEAFPKIIQEVIEKLKNY